MAYLLGRLRYIDEIEAGIRREAVARERLMESERLHRATIENISDAVLVTGNGGAFTYVCPNTELIFGLSQAEVLARTQAALIDERLATKDDLQALELRLSNQIKELDARLNHQIREMESRLKYDLTVRLGSMLVVIAGLVIAVLKLIQ